MADEPTQPTPTPPAPSNFPGDTASTSAKETAALSSAASELKISEVSEAEPSTNGASTSTTTAVAKSAPVDVKKVKVDAKDVAWMVEELELSKSKATELLKAAGGEREVAVRGFVVGEGVA